MSNIKINGGLLTPLLGVDMNDATIFGDTGILFDSKLSLLINSVSFDVAASPVYGDFANGTTLGLLGYVKNVGFGTMSTIAPYKNWVATPGVHAPVPVPEPATLITLGSSLLMALSKYRKRKVQTA